MIKQISKKLYILSAIALFNLLTVIFVANFISQPSEIVESVSESNQQIVTPASVAQKCIIIIDNVQYDVTQFKYIHSGGNTFDCGSNMTTDFWNRHSQKQLNQMQRYRI